MLKPKVETIEEFRKDDKDTGSSRVQIAILTERIRHLTEHLKSNRKDFHSRRGLVAMTSRRRKLLDYVKRGNLEEYNELLQKLNIRR